MAGKPNAVPNFHIWFQLQAVDDAKEILSIFSDDIEALGGEILQEVDGVISIYVNSKADQPFNRTEFPRLAQRLFELIPTDCIGYVAFVFTDEMDFPNQAFPKLPRAFLDQAKRTQEWEGDEPESDIQIEIAANGEKIDSQDVSFPDGLDLALRIERNENTHMRKYDVIGECEWARMPSDFVEDMRQRQEAAYQEEPWEKPEPFGNRAFPQAGERDARTHSCLA